MKIIYTSFQEIMSEQLSHVQKKKKINIKWVIA